MTTATRGTIGVGDATIEYFADGAGDPIVLLPAGGFDAGYFGDLGRRLADAGFRAIAMNPRVTGESTGPLAGMTLHTLAADVAGVIEAVGDRKAHLLGHGFSNRIARCVVADRPDLVRSIILLAGVGNFDPRPDVINALVTLFRPDATEAECLEAMRSEVADPSTAPRLFRTLTRFPAAAAAYRLADRATPSGDWERAPGRPMLVVQGVDDRIAPPSHGRALRDAMSPHVRVADIPRAGHMVVLEQPEAVADAVISFLRDPT
jgi:pimeloyl-ACP methyl ester carboxylesterase